MAREVIQTDAAPAAIGPYSQAVRVDGLLFCSGQIPLHPETGELVDGEMAAQIRQAFDNLTAVITAAGCTMGDVVRLTVYLTDLSHFGLVNEIMAERFAEPYPARAALGVAALPKGAAVELDAIAVHRG